MFTCDFCGDTFSLRSSLSRHINIHKILSFQCDLCNKTFGRKDNLRRRVQKLHDIPTHDKKISSDDDEIDNEEPLQKYITRNSENLDLTQSEAKRFKYIFKYKPSTEEVLPWTLIPTQMR